MSAVGTFFRSRWIEAPAHMTELPGGLPRDSVRRASPAGSRNQEPSTSG